MTTPDLAFPVGLDVMAVPDYIGGFIFGMTGNNHLSEIEACYNGSTGVEEDAHKGLESILHGKFSKGAMQFWLAFHEFDNALKDCENIGDDLNAIESWGTIFAHPRKLSETVAKNMLLHRKTVNENIAKEKSDWAAGDYWQAGIDTAVVLTEVLGPIEPAEEIAALQ